MLARRERIVGTQVLRHVEGHRDGVVGEALDRGDPQPVEDGMPPGTGPHSGGLVTVMLQRLYVVEGLQAGTAGPQRLARGRPEPADLTGVR